MKKITLITLSLILMASVGFSKPTPRPDEGMWLPMFFKNLNYSTMKKMGLKLTADELYSINNSSLKDAIVQFGNGCTGEIVSEKGLLFTNHHCGYDAIAGQSTVEHDYLNNGFWAYNMSEEIPIPNMTVSFLVRMEDVTKDILGEYSNKIDKSKIEDSIEVRINALIEKNSENGQYKVEIKPFFESAEYYMFVYEVFNDIRLVGTPPQSIGKFGGDTDNWMWPRHTGDFSIFRVYANSENKPSKFSKENQPYKPKHFLPISIKGVKKDDFAMIWGFPGSTERYMTSGEVANTINIVNPSIVRAGEYMLPTMNKMMEKDNRVNLIYASDYAGYMNLWKNKKGELRGLKKLDIFGKKKAIEDRLTKWILEDKSRFEKYGSVVKDLEEANKEIANANGTKYSWYANLGLMSNKRALLAFQNTMSLMTLDKKNPNYDKIITILKKRGDAHFETYDQETEKELFKSLITMFSNIDKNNFISKTLENKFKGNVDAFADKAFKESVFANQTNFDKFMKKPNPKKLGKDLIAQSALTAYTYLGVGEENLVKAEEKLSSARVRFVAALREMDPSLVQYPDANFTMRMTYGRVLDYYPADGIHYDYITTLAGVMEKEDPSSSEFQVPAKLKELYLKKDYGQYANEKGEIITCFLSDNDITGGNSGSPILNAEGHLIGLAFDGNWEAMSGDIAFEPEFQRTINVDARYVLFIIDKFAGAKNLIDELTIIK
ncbi:MAG: S46 family peptidase [Bacteroidales bacterium]|nr:S46 family peptidase [Bacteroidales bacterium]MDD4684005.1 S46 family peptidase [Bacteroidales bacterium]